MSCNIVSAWPIAIVGISDRRVTEFVSKKPKTNRSTKMTLFGCADAHGLIVYNGIGMDDEGLTPSDWLMQLAEQKVFDNKLQDLLEHVRTDLETRLRKLRANYGSKNARHTFTFGVWHDGESEIHDVSNFEFLDEGEELVEGSETVRLTSFLSAPNSRIRIVAGGTRPPKADIKSICEAIKTKSVDYVVARCIKVVRDVAYRQGRAKGTVGAAVQWAKVGKKREEVWCGLDVAGGRVAQESPNVINIQAQSPVAGTLSVQFGSVGMFKDAYAYAVAEDGTKIDIAHYDPATKKAAFTEPKCGVCGSPWPASHRYCEVCLYDEHHARGKKQRPRQNR